MSAHRASFDFQETYTTKSQTIDDPGVGGTFNLAGKWGGVALATSTKRLPPGMPLGTLFFVYATGNLTLTNPANETILTVSEGHVVLCFAMPNDAWAAIPIGPNGTRAGSVVYYDTHEFGATNVQSAIDAIASVVF